MQKTLNNTCFKKCGVDSERWPHAEKEGSPCEFEPLNSCITPFYSVFYYTVTRKIMSEPKSIWEMAEAGEGMIESGSGASNSRGRSADDNSSTVLVVGDTGVGKSSLIQSFLKPNSSKQPKSTFALEYSFARRKNAGSDSDGKTLAHIWELGGDIYEPKLLEIALSVDNLSTASVIICVDLSKPQDCFASIKSWITTIRSHVTNKYTSLKNGNNHMQNMANNMKEHALSSYGNIENPHVDASRVRPSEVPLTIICCKYDQFRNKHSVSDRRSLLQTLRFAAHYHGANLLVTSTSDGSGKEAFRAIMNSLCFGVNMKPICEISVDRPCVVTSGKDSYQTILTGKGTSKGTSSDENSSAASAFASNDSDVSSYLSSSGVNKDTWQRFESVLNSIYGEPNPRAGKGPISASMKDDTGDDTYNPAIEHPETDIDEARAARDIALDQYIADAARREKMASRSSLQDIDSIGVENRGGGEQYADTEDDRRRSRK